MLLGKMNAVLKLHLLVLFVFTFLQFTSGYDLEIGVLREAGTSVDQAALQTLSAASMADTVVYPLTDSNFQLQSMAYSHVCNGTVAFISTDTCSGAVIEALDGASVPVVRVNDDVTCPTESFSSNTIQMPRFQNLDYMLRHLVANLHWMNVMIFYDSTKEHYHRRVVSAFLMSHMIVEDREVSVTATDTDVLNLLKSTIAKYPRGNLHIVFATSYAVFAKFVSQATGYASTNNAFAAIFPNSQWLAISDDADVTTFESHVGAVINFAIFHIIKAKPTTLQTRLENAMATTSLSLAQVFFDTSVFSYACISASHINLVKEIRRRVEKTADDTCNRYDLITADWSGSSQVIKRGGICNSAGSIKNTLNVFSADMFSLGGRTLKVATLPVSPFVISDSVNGQTVYSGLCIEVLQSLALQLNFTFEIELPTDGQFGVATSDGSWTGLVGMLQNKEVDMVLAPLTVTNERKTVMDFTDPFFFEKAALLLRLPDEDEGKWQVIIKPLSWPVWLCVAASVPIVGVAAWVVSHLSMKLLQLPTKKEDQFVKLGNACWYIFGATFSQGGAYQPQSMAGRSVVGFWWAYCMVLVATYGGNLIAFLTISIVEVPVDNFHGLVDQSRYSWGTLGGSSYVTQLQGGGEPVFADVWAGIEKRMARDPSVLSPDFNVHMEKIQKRNYAMIGDRTSLLEQRVKDCSLSLVFEPLIGVVYSIGLPLGSPYKQMLNQVLHSLRGGGMVDHWQMKYWPKDNLCDGLNTPEARAMDLLDTQGAFYLLTGGIVVGACFMAYEIIRYNKTEKKKVKVFLG